MNRSKIKFVSETQMSVPGIEDDHKDPMFELTNLIFSAEHQQDGF